MNRSARESTMAHLPWGLLGMFLLVLGTECFVERHDHLWSTPAALNARFAARAARLESHQCATLCFGDSLIQRGILPRWIEEQLGRPAYNLAVQGGQAPMSYFLLRRALDAGARPEVLIVDFFPGLLAADPRINARTWPELLDTDEWLDLAWTTLDPPLIRSTLLGRAVPSWRARSEIRAAVLTTLRGERDTLFVQTQAAERNWRINRGAQADPKELSHRDDSALIARQIRGGSWSCDPANAVYLKRFLDLALEHEITVIWLLPPISPGWQSRRESVGLEAQYDRFVQSWQARYANLTIVDARHSGYGAESFTDPFHLDHQGAATLSAEMGEFLQRWPHHRDLDRWVALEEFRDPSHDVLVENVEQSRLAVRSSTVRWE